MPATQLTAAILAALNNLGGGAPDRAEFTLGDWLNDVRLRPSVADFASLPSSGNVAGDIRLVESEFQLYVWDGSSWLQLAGSSVPMLSGFDGSNYYELDDPAAMVGSDDFVAAVLFEPRMARSGAGAFICGAADNSPAGGWLLQMGGAADPQPFSFTAHDGTPSIVTTTMFVDEGVAWGIKKVLLVAHVHTSGGTTTFDLYLNGQITATAATAVNGVTPSPVAFRLGDGGVNWFGDFAEFSAIAGVAYVDAALTQADILAYTEAVLDANDLVAGAIAWDNRFVLSNQSGVPGTWTPADGAANLVRTGSALARSLKKLPWL